MNVWRCVRGIRTCRSLCIQCRATETFKRGLDSWLQLFPPTRCAWITPKFCCTNFALWPRICFRVRSKLKKIARQNLKEKTIFLLAGTFILTFRSSVSYHQYYEKEKSKISNCLKQIYPNCWQGDSWFVSLFLQGAWEIDRLSCHEIFWKWSDSP